jgi:uncharacterized protein
MSKSREAPVQNFLEKYGPWAVIAGGSDGIGAAFARELANRGLNIILIARSHDTLDALAAEIRARHDSIEVRTVALDLSLDEAADRVAEATSGVEVGCLVYNVGSEPMFGDLLDHEWSFIRGRLHRNIVTKTALAHHFGRAMRQRGRGGVVLMGSMSGYFGNPGFALYAATKAYSRFLAEALWYEFKKDGVDLISPVVGPTDTPTMVKAYGRLENAMDPAEVATSSLDRLGSAAIWVADDIAAQVAAMEAMAPEERSSLAAGWAEDFVLHGKKPGQA